MIAGNGADNDDDDGHHCDDGGGDGDGDDDGDGDGDGDDCCGDDNERAARASLPRHVGFMAELVDFL